jgi:signal transduction histidine kinase
VSLRSGQLSINPSPVVVNEILREVVTVHEVLAREKGLELDYDPGTDVMRAEADRARLMQLFQNLIGNAVKFCKSGDTIKVSSRTQGSCAHIEISDSGPGISTDDLPHIFDPYYSASRKLQKTGTGLGLFIAKGIVDAHGGQIRCESAAGVGTTFNITLPLQG